MLDPWQYLATGKCKNAISCFTHHNVKINDAFPIEACDKGYNDIVLLYNIINYQNYSGTS